MTTARPECVYRPCRRCDRAGRTSWRAREGWHNHRRLVWQRRAKLTAVYAAVLVLLWLAIPVMMAVWG